ncbi:MAG: UDP-N-acetylglucosamine 2-epimerase [Candidatus Omnitrophota bacterium]
MRRIAVVTGTRAEYGILHPVMERIASSPALELAVIAAGMHLSPDYGLTVREIERDKMPLAAKVDMLFSSDLPSAMAKGLGIGIYGMAQEVERLKPDAVVILGDRVEAFAGAIAGLFGGAVLAHIHGGEVTQGGFDEYMRHAITKLSHLHFAATPKSRERIVRLGENPDYVFHTGTPGLDALQKYPRLSDEEISQRIGFPLPERYALIAQHPVSTRPHAAAAEIAATLEAFKRSGLPCFLMSPNADAGGREMLAKIREYQKGDWLKTIVHVPRAVYCNLLRRCAVLAGNSSSGIIDSPAYGVPAIDIGDRQAGRERGDNVISAPPIQTEIEKAIDRALNDAEFLRKAWNTVNPYGDGKASERIVEILETADWERTKNEKRHAADL